MNKFIVIISFILLAFNSSFSQENQGVKAINENEIVDNKYKEDQFYFGLSYNLLGKKPSGIKQNGFSSGVFLGYIKDMPINTKRNVAIGVGLGLSTNSFNQNLLISKDNSGTISYTNLSTSQISFTKNKFFMHMVELPIEFRWRTSTATEYKFWRIYTGFKLAYVFANSSKFESDTGNQKITNNSDFNKLQYGLTLSAGYNSINIQAYYGLNSIFSNSAKLDGKSIDMNAIKIGLIFYLL